MYSELRIAVKTNVEVTADRVRVTVIRRIYALRSAGPNLLPRLSLTGATAKILGVFFRAVVYHLVELSCILGIARRYPRPTITTISMHILVTGAAGLIGSHVMLALLDEGHSILATDINPLPSKVIDDIGSRIEQVDQITGDLTSVFFVDELFASYSTPINGVMHIGGIRSPVGVDPRIVHNINVVATYNVLQTAAAKGITRIVQASSCNALGLSWTSLEHWNLDFVPVDESHPMRPVSGTPSNRSRTLTIFRRIHTVSQSCMCSRRDDADLLVPVKNKQPPSADTFPRLG